LGDGGVDERIMLNLVLKKLDVRAWIGFIWLRIGPVAGDNESSSLKSSDFLAK
jgi:hypothetical protein